MKENHYFIFLEIFSQEGGIQSYIKDVLEAYQSLDYQAEIFLLRDIPELNNPFDQKKLKFYYLKTLPPFLGRLKLVITLFIRLIINRPTHIFCGHIKLAGLINFFSKMFNIPYTILTYGKEVWQKLSPIESKALTEATHIWTISRYSQKCLCLANNIDLNKVKILPCVVDQNKFTPGEKSPELLLKYNLKNSQVLMTVTRLWSGDIYKGVDVTIRALPQILEHFPNVKYLVIGRGDDLPRLAQLSRDLKVENKVIFAGFISSEELVNHYRIADAYIMPSQEGFGIVYLEAMCCGIPVLSGDDDGSADPLQDGVLGWRVPHRDVNAVALACIEMLKGDDIRVDGKYLREQTLTKFSKAVLSDQLKLLL